MQWLINLIIEAAKSQIGFFDRGDPASYDFSGDNFIIDGSWHTWDLSSIVPPNARLITFQIRLLCTNSGTQIQFRKNGNLNSFVYARTAIIVADMNQHFAPRCACDSGRKIQYRITGSGWSKIEGNVTGWFL